jgi:hypothetical protein
MENTRIHRNADLWKSLIICKIWQLAKDFVSHRGYRALPYFRRNG